MRIPPGENSREILYDRSYIYKSDKRCIIYERNLPIKLPKNVSTYPIFKNMYNFQHKRWDFSSRRMGSLKIHRVKVHPYTESIIRSLILARRVERLMSREPWHVRNKEGGCADYILILCQVRRDSEEIALCQKHLYSELFPSAALQAAHYRRSILLNAFIVFF